ncbi:TPA: hypothetical protein DDZ86_00695 [Candidatus Dependentiae bacterium]|nr:MAG: hypothetical protein UW09_C0004G0019 [candidate division TM6 bacterium GW2011_GWF2_43_87]HBL98142.1 hypothetical protein [Candidatus Dependentiae bacterium]
MALKELVRPNPSSRSITEENEGRIKENKVQEFIAQGGSAPKDPQTNEIDHRLTLRIPQWLIAKIDLKRKERIGSISRNLWILEQLEKACKK